MAGTVTTNTKKYYGGLVPEPTPQGGGDGKTKVLVLRDVTVVVDEHPVTKKLLCDPDSIITAEPFIEVVTAEKLAGWLDDNYVIVLDDGTQQVQMLKASVSSEGETPVCNSVVFKGLKDSKRASIEYPCQLLTDESTLTNFIEAGTPVIQDFAHVLVDGEDTRQKYLEDAIIADELGKLQVYTGEAEDSTPENPNKILVIDDHLLREDIDSNAQRIDNLEETINEMDMDSVPHAYLHSTLSQSAGDSVTTRTEVNVFAQDALEGDCFEFEQTTTIDDTPFGYVWIEPGTYLINASVTLQWLGDPRGTFVAKVGSVMGENFDFSQEQEIKRNTTKVVTIPNRMKLAVNITYDAGTPVMGFWIQSMQVVKLAGGMSQTNIIHDSTLAGQGSVADPIGVTSDAFSKIKDIPTSIASFRTGDVIAVDGPNGTANMTKDDLLRETSENALAGNVAPAFDPNKPNDEGGYAYHIGEVLINNGQLLRVKINKPQGTFDESYFEHISFEEYLKTSNPFYVKKYDFGVKGTQVLVWTSQELKSGHTYRLTIKSESLLSYSGSQPIIYFNRNLVISVASFTAQEVYNGASVFYTPSIDGVWGIRCRTDSVYVNCRCDEVLYTQSLYDALNQKADAAHFTETQSKTIVSSVTTPIATGIQLRKGLTYNLYAKSDIRISAVTNVNIFYTQPTYTVLASCTSGQLYSGFSVSVTPSSDTELYIRTNQIGVTVEVVAERFKDIPDMDTVSDIENTLIYTNESDERENYVVPNVSTTYSSKFILHKGVVYNIYLKSDSEVEYSGSAFVAYASPLDGSAQYSIASSTSLELAQGFTFNFTPTEDVELFIRTRAAGVGETVKVKHVKKSADAIQVQPHVDKIWALYGDSISAISNGNGLFQGWALGVNDAIPFKNFYGRSIGGSSYKFGTAGGVVTFVSNVDGKYNSKDNSHSKDDYTGDIPEGCVAIRSSFCSWDRITHMFPSSIKDSIDIICVMGGTNDSLDSSECEFIENSAVDPEWASSGSSYYGRFNGDYNITTFKGAIASTIMKFQAWMPNALIVICTPLSGRGEVGEISVDTNLPEYSKSLVEKEMAARLSCNCIDIFGTCGITPFCRNEYITDNVHPYSAKGYEMLARAFISGLRIIDPVLTFVKR